jgi:hypothetical protein
MKQLESIIYLSVRKYLSQKNIQNVLDHMFQLMEGKKKSNDFLLRKIMSTTI